MDKANSVMVAILNKQKKFEDKQKLMEMKILYVELIEKMTDLELFEDTTIEERR